MPIKRDGHLGCASRVLATEVASAIGRQDLTAPTERDLQRLAGDTIDKTMADAIIDRAHPLLIRFGINGATSATVAVLYTMLSVPPPPTLDCTPPARPRLATDLPPDTATLRTAFGHAPRSALRATCAAYSLPIPKTAMTCMTCATSNMRKAPASSHSSRSPAHHTVVTGSSWSGYLIGPVRIQSCGGVVYGLHLIEHNAH